MRKTFAVLVCSAASIWASTQSSNGDSALARADALAEIYNWHASAPFYAEAERAFGATHKSRQALAAHIGYVRATLESRSFAETARYFAAVCQQPVVKDDSQLLFRCLVAKADTDAEIDSAPAEADRRRVLASAGSLQNEKWVNRATGEIGFHQYVQGDHTAAKRNTALALLRARQSGDWAAQIRFASGIGTGLVLAGFADMGMPYLDTAIDLAKQHPESGYQFMAIAGKVMALIQKPDYAQAETYALEQRQHAERDDRLVKYTQAQLFLADVAIGRGERERAIEILMSTIAIASHNRTRLLREVYSKLSDLYRQKGNLRIALRYANAALTGCQDSKDMYLVPSILLTVARLKIALHEDTEAGLILQRATDVIEGMLVHTSDLRARDAMLAAMSDVYRLHFALAARHHDVAKAFSIIEQVRGRYISELLVNKQKIHDLDEPNPALEDRITALKIQLVTATTAVERQNVSDRLFYTEQARWVHLRNAALRSSPLVSLARFRSSLPSGELFLEYVLTDDASYCILISKEEARIVRLAGQGTIRASVEMLLDNVRNGRDTSDSGRSLFRLVVEPLGDLSQYSSVEISPDDILNTLPFEILRTASNRYWGFDTTITYTPSAGTELLLANTMKPDLNRTFFGIGGVPYDSEAGAETLAASSRGGDSDPYDISDVHDLPSSEEEVKTAAAVLGANSSKFALGRDATKTDFETADLAQYAIIHFATPAQTWRTPSCPICCFAPHPPTTDSWSLATLCSANFTVPW
jgi:tetratricopeptide (TPR) repeat protein